MSESAISWKVRLTEVGNGQLGQSYSFMLFCGYRTVMIATLYSVHPPSHGSLHVCQLPHVQLNAHSNFHVISISAAVSRPRPSPLQRENTA